MRFSLPILLCFWICTSAPGQDTPAKKLSEYQLKSQVDPIPGIQQNASGMTWSPVSKSLFVVLDSPNRIVEYEPGGRMLRRIKLHEFQDVEGIAHVKDNVFALAEEGKGTVSVIEIPRFKTDIRKSDRIWKIPVIKVGGNLGLEGITYDPKAEVFYVVKEKDPLSIYQATVNGKVSRLTAFAASPQFQNLKDLSGIHFDPKTNHLILLSHESKVAMEFTREGKFVSQLPIELRKAEGITIDDAGTLYICGEPSELHVYK